MRRNFEFENMGIMREPEMITLKKAVGIIVSQIRVNEFLSVFFLSVLSERNSLFKSISEINQIEHIIANTGFK
jgi:hypothetical protein